MASGDDATLYKWDEVPLEKVNDMLDRKLITGERMMLAHVYLEKGCVATTFSTIGPLM